MGGEGALRPPIQRSGSPSTTSGFMYAQPSPEHPSSPDLVLLRLPELRALRREAQQHEADLSYVRRLLQGRIDILRAELARRGGSGAASGGRPPRVGGAGSGSSDGSGGGSSDAGGGGGFAGPVGAHVPVPVASSSVVDRLAEILTDQPARNRSSARHVTLGTPHSEEYRQLAADMLAEVALSDLEARTDLELRSAMSRLVQYEQDVSRRRRRFQRTADDCSAEIARRYRDGEAQVDDLLA
ncbi:RsiG family protein [Streptomyces himalayensis]